MPSHHDATGTYRLIITRREATEILMLPNDTDWTLPRVEIRKQQRIAEQLTAEVDKAWGLKVCCLFITNRHTSVRSEDATCAVMECVKHNERAPAGTYWMPLNVAECRDAEEAAVVRDAFVKMASYTRGENFGPFAKPGWMRELFRWVHDQTAPLGLRLTGNFRQYSASPTSSLLRLETDGDALWFKATGEPNQHERLISLSVAKLFPGHVPQILGIHPTWNGWLTAEASGIALDEMSDCFAWERVARELAELQIASIGKTPQLLEENCKDLRLSRIVKLIDPFVARMGEFMAVQKKRNPAPLASAELASLNEGLKEACSLLQSFGLPDTLGHTDPNPGNILISLDRCIFLDWAEGCVTNPMITFEYLRRHLERSAVDKPTADSRITAAYVSRWTSFFSPEDLRRAIAVVRPVAAFLYAVAGDTWRSLDAVSNPALAGYYRSLARQMYRDAAVAAERSERCLA